MYDPRDRKSQVFQILASGAIRVNKLVPSRNKGKKLKQSAKIWIVGKGLVDVESSN